MYIHVYEHVEWYMCESISSTARYILQSNIMQLHMYMYMYIGQVRVK